MAISIHVNFDGDSPVLNILSRLSDLNQDKLFALIGTDIVEATRTRFVMQHDVDGNPWKQSWRAKLQNGQTLRDTGRLMNSFTYNVLPNGVEVGTNVEYAAPLQLGAHIYPKTAQYLVFAVMGNFRKVKEVHNEPRSFLGINKNDEVSIINVIHGFLNV